MAGTFTLSDDPRVRYATGAIMYFSQGIHKGLLAIAMPAWLASQGVEPAKIASYLAIIVLPWAFKLVTGPLMDRYEFLPMGRRRPWVIGAEVGVLLSLLALVLVERPAEQIGLLTLIGVLINSFAATQDVAVDGMSIDLTPVREQGHLNGFMSFGKAVGWRASAAVSGVLLTTWGLQATAILAAAVGSIPLLAILFAREREGERALPWTRGMAATVKRADTSFGEVFRGINKVLWVRSSLIVMAIMFFEGLIYGYGQALMPIAAINLFGYTTAQWSQLVAMMGLIGAVIALSMGPLIDRLGAKRMLFLAITLVGIHALLIAQTQHLWQNTIYVRVMLSIYVLMLPVVMVSVIALAMAVCSSTFSTTQFAIYMSVANLGHSAGSKIYGMVAVQSTYAQSYALLSVLAVVLIVLILFHRHRRSKSRREEPAKGRFLTTHSEWVARRRAPFGPVPCGVRNAERTWSNSSSKVLRSIVARSAKVSGSTPEKLKLCATRRQQSQSTQATPAQGNKANLSIAISVRAVADQWCGWSIRNSDTSGTRPAAPVTGRFWMPVNCSIFPRCRLRTSSRILPRPNESRSVALA